MPPQGPPQTRPFLFEIGRSETGCLGWGSESLIYSLVLACATGGYSRARGGCLWKRRYLRSRFLAGETPLAASTFVALPFSWRSLLLFLASSLAVMST